MRFPFFRQLDKMDCGPTCLKMISAYHGKTFSLPQLREKSYITREGVTFLGLSQAAEALGFRTLAVQLTYEELMNEVPLPCIIHWNQEHFAVLCPNDEEHSFIQRAFRWFRPAKIAVADPAHAIIQYTKEEFLRCWLHEGADEHEGRGIVLLLEPTPEFYEQEEFEKTTRARKVSFLFQYFRPHTALMWQLGIGLLVGNMLQFVLPFLTQSIVDIGVQTQNLGFVYVILLAQLMLFVGQMSVNFIRAWLLLHLSTRVNVALIRDFLIKLLRLPVSFFQQKNTNDIVQRVQDNFKIQTFLSTQSLQVVFSFVNIIIFGIVLAFYHILIFVVFVVGSALYLFWLLIFLRKRKDLTYKNFQLSTVRQNILLDLVRGIEEIKINHAETIKRWDYERVQGLVFRLHTRVVALEQYQKGGSMAINELKNILITFIAAQAVIEGSLTLGMMLSVQYILGQLQAPISDMGELIHQYQDAKISLERMAEIYEEKDEDTQVQGSPVPLEEIPKDIHLRHVSFHYQGLASPRVLDDLTFTIPAGKVTAIVGASGSGKTTLLNLLLKFYAPTTGELKLDKHKFNALHPQQWRMQCGSVQQQGFIFSDTIARNIALSEETIDYPRLYQAAEIANIHTFIEELALGYATRIGESGVGLSGGQRQRILIARAIYKNPLYVFFDEATSALDANNEKVIMENLQKFYEGKTVVVIAHRLSTVKNADQILVLEQGRLIEQGNHEDLTKKQGAYYALVKNQLELGN